MGHNHSHGDFTKSRTKSKKAMIIVFAMTLAFMFMEVVAGFWTGSLALVADAGHMLGDAAALGLALIAIWFSSKPAGPGQTYGYYRSEILAAFLNGIFLVGMSIFILYEAIHRIFAPPEVMSGPMMVVAFAGLVINIVGAKLLSGDSGNSLNAKAAYFEVISDLLGSVAVLVAGGIMLFTKWYWVDPVISGLIGLMILPRTWSLIKECIHILMQGSPKHINIEALRADLLAVPGVLEMHDLHLWTVTQGKDVLSCHIVISESAISEEVRQKVVSVLDEKFAIHHSTIQVEQNNCNQSQETGCSA